MKRHAQPITSISKKARVPSKTNNRRGKSKPVSLTTQLKEHVKGKDFVKSFITSYRAASLATLSLDGRPHVAIVFCVVHEDLSLYFSTRVEGRKYQNLLEHPYVALAFSNKDSLQTVQLTGIAERIDNLDTEQSVLHDLMKLRYQDPQWPPPPFKLFERGATNELAVIKVTPTEMTFADFETSQVGRYKPFFYKII